MLIRPETADDYLAIRQLITTAFANAEHSDGTEQDLVERLRQSKGFIPELALVAEQQGQIIGYILLTEIELNGQTELALAPLAVAPDNQRQGIGRQLIEQAHQFAHDLGYHYIIVLGSNHYYPKFGYEPAIRYGVQAPFDVPSEYFMLKTLRASNRDIAGKVVYPAVFFE